MWGEPGVHVKGSRLSAIHRLGPLALGACATRDGQNWPSADRQLSAVELRRRTFTVCLIGQAGHSRRITS